MAKIKNKTVYSDDTEYLQRLADELEFIGRSYRLDLKAGELTQFALQPRRQKKSKEKQERDKRSEKFERKER